MSQSSLVALIDLPGVADSADAARKRVDELLWNRSLAVKAGALAKDCSIQSARSSAAIDGIDFAMAAWASGDAFEDSPIGKAAAGVWRMEHELRGLTAVWTTAPLQALARMHSVLALDVVSVDQLGRPRSDGEPDDPLRIKSVPELPAMRARLAALSEIVTEAALVPAVVEAAIVHGELLALRPFAWGSGPIARASMRLVLAARGVDPDMLVMVDSAFLSIGRPAYVDAIRGYLSGTTTGVAKWLRFCSDGVAVGARLSNERIGLLP